MKVTRGRSRLLFDASCVITAPVGAVSELVLNVHPGPANRGFVGSRAATHQRFQQVVRATTDEPGRSTPAERRDGGAP